MKNTLCTLYLFSLFNVFNDHLHFDALITGLFQIFLTQSLVKLLQKVQFKRWEVSLAWGQENSLAKRLAWVYWGYHSCYIYVTWKSKEVVRRREVLKPSYRGRGRCSFYGMQLTTLDIMLTIFSLVIALQLIDDVNHHMHLFLTCTYSRQFQTFLVCH